MDQNRPAAHSVSGHSHRRTRLPRRGEPAAADGRCTGLMEDRLDVESKRVLVLAPTGRDSAAACALLQQAGMMCTACSSIEELHRELAVGAGAALVAEEAFFAADLSALFNWVGNQLPW